METFSNQRPAAWLREMAQEEVDHDATPCECAGYVVELRDIRQLVQDNAAQAKAIERLQFEKEELHRMLATVNHEWNQVRHAIRKLLREAP